MITNSVITNLDSPGSSVDLTGYSQESEALTQYSLLMGDSAGKIINSSITDDGSKINFTRRINLVGPIPDGGASEIFLSTLNGTTSTFFNVPVAGSHYLGVGFSSKLQVSASQVITPNLIRAGTFAGSSAQINSLSTSLPQFRGEFDSTDYHTIRTIAGGDTTFSAPTGDIILSPGGSRNLLTNSFLEFSSTQILGNVNGIGMQDSGALHLNGSNRVELFVANARRFRLDSTGLTLNAATVGAAGLAVRSSDSQWRGEFDSTDYHTIQTVVGGGTTLLSTGSLSLWANGSVKISVSGGDLDFHSNENFTITSLTGSTISQNLTQTGLTLNTVSSDAGWKNRTSLAAGGVTKISYNNDGIGLHGAAPTAQSAAIADATDAATTQAALNTLLAHFRLRGDIAS